MPVRGKRVFSPGLIGLLIFAALLLTPIVTILLSVFQSDDGIWAHLYETVLSSYITNSLFLVVGVGVSVLVLGVIPAWLVTMFQFPFQRVLEWALLLPLAMPAYIIAYTYTGMLDVGGPVQGWIRETLSLKYGEYWFPEIRSLGGAIAMLSLVLYPYVYLLTRTALIEQSACVLEVARTLGCNTWQAFRRVALPLARPAIVAGCSLVMMETLADYGTVQYFGVPTFTTGIFRTWFGLGSSVAAAQLSALLMMFILVLLVLEAWSRRQARYHHTTSRYGRLAKPQLHGVPMVAAVTFCVTIIALGFLVPAAQLLVWALSTGTDRIADGFIGLVMNTVGLALFVSCIILLPALVTTYTKRRQPGRLSRGLTRLLGLGYGIPGIVIAVGVMIPFAWLDNSIDNVMREQFSVSTGLLLSGTLFALVFAYIVRFLPLALNTVDAGLGKIKPTVDDAARTLGLSASGIVAKIHMPIMRGTLLTAVLLVFVDVMKELPATLVLRPFNFNTLAVRTYELANDERLAEAAAPALMIVIAGIIPVILLSRAIATSRPGHDESA